ncbi:MAG: hemolysin-type calcium-binding repeat family protein, partial [Rhizobium sp.]|nr:hemolysin-type calcium-binding repeat family protein [Rhizobium sp.]
YSMTLSDTLYILGKNASIDVAGDYALYEQDGVGGNRVIIRGSVIGSENALDAAIGLEGKNSEVWIAKTGLVHAFTGIQMGAYEQQVTNYGKIDATGFGIWAQSNGTVRNFGLISGDDNGFISGGVHSVDVFNGKAGRIVSDNVAVHIQGGTDTTSTLTNEGMINGRGARAFSSSWGDETVVNHGVMKGLISMGAGNDLFDNRGGKVDHAIYGEAGDDTLITNSAKVHLQEDAGMGSDTVRSTVSYTLTANVETLVLLGKADLNGSGNDIANTLTGNKGDNRLQGLAGFDILNGASGNDILTGGADADVFVFAKRGGHDVITDFTGGLDYIDLKGQTVIDDYYDMINNYVRQSHGDLTIHMGKDTLTLQDTTLADLDVKDFFFS